MWFVDLCTAIDVFITEQSPSLNSAKYLQILAICFVSKSYFTVDLTTQLSELIKILKLKLQEENC